MKRELIAAVLLLALAVGSYGSIRHTDTLTQEVGSLLEVSQAAAELENYSLAYDAAEEALELWLGADRFTHIVIRQSEVDNTADVFYDLTAAICAQEKDALPHLYAKLRYHLKGIADMEHIGLGSVL